MSDYKRKYFEDMSELKPAFTKQLISVGDCVRVINGDEGIIEDIHDNAIRIKPKRNTAVTDHYISEIVEILPKGVR